MVPAGPVPMVSWDVVVPSWPGVRAGVQMAGFSDPDTDLGSVLVVPPGAVIVVFDLGDTPINIADALATLGDDVSA